VKKLTIEEYEKCLHDLVNEIRNGQIVRVDCGDDGEALIVMNEGHYEIMKDAPLKMYEFTKAGLFGPLERPRR
jgi:general stress protein 26